MAFLKDEHMRVKAHIINSSVHIGFTYDVSIFWHIIIWLFHVAGIAEDFLLELHQFFATELATKQFEPR